MRTYHDLTGNKFGRLAVLGRALSEPGKRKWLVRCDCGVERIVPTFDLQSGHTKTCGCSWRNPSRIENLGSFSRVFLNDSEKIAIIDAAAIPKVSGIAWSCLQSGRLHYAYSPKTIAMHRLISGASRGQIVDHINGDGLDNRICNLRLTNRFGNGRNRQTPSNNSSGFKGVSWHKASNKWASHIGANGRQHHLGCFESIIDAAKAYNDAAVRIFGEFARLNVLPQEPLV